MELDKIDKSILTILQVNAKITNAALAQQINLSPAATLERVKKLEQYKVITNYYAQIDYTQVGFDIALIVGITFQKMTGTVVKLFQAAIDKIASVLMCYQVIGNFDFILMVQTKDMASYQSEVVEKLYMLDGVERIQTLTVTQLLKNKPLRLG
ncbi:Lrp/AsnC family transcriptional regulator [Candidatus Cardinium hertigii]|uniref:Leucine-responsive regulatory protein n=1 Tax=Candidatus Cardinium hertigii TaxID=247481 RepID=A0A2Z3L8J9_9BACT|nr:Lrp/AsnC family transcriptional regulator [Candidatus Cardinium hertigii]AWN81913.1 Leucine-responsive regulatory protein [Candidatus Cardinium hertigii]